MDNKIHPNLGFCVVTPYFLMDSYVCLVLLGCTPKHNKPSSNRNMGDNFYSSVMDKGVTVLHRLSPVKGLGIAVLVDLVQLNSILLR